MTVLRTVSLHSHWVCLKTWMSFSAGLSSSLHVPYRARVFDSNYPDIFYTGRMKFRWLPPPPFKPTFTIEELCDATKLEWRELQVILSFISKNLGELSLLSFLQASAHVHVNLKGLVTVSFHTYNWHWSPWCSDTVTQDFCRLVLIWDRLTGS